MKKSKLRPINKKALKAIALTVAVSTIGGFTLSDHIKNVKQKKQVNDFKQELIQYEASINKAQNTRYTDDAVNEMETIDISCKHPRIAIIYHDNGKISLMFNREYLSLERAMQKYPELTSEIRKYINVTHNDTMNQPTQATDKTYTENGLGK